MRVRGFSRWIPVALLSAAVLLLCLRCAHREPESGRAEPAAPVAGSEQPATVPAPSELAEPSEPEAEDVKAAAEPQTPDEAEDEAGDAQLNPVAQFMRHSDEHDRNLLASVERETKKSPSPEVMELLALRRAGATRTELERFIDTELAADVRVRLAAKRWLRASMGGPAPEPSPLPGAGGGTRQVKPLAPR